MDTCEGLLVTGGVAGILGGIRGKGVELWSENGQLHYKAPRGALTREELETLRRYKNQIATYLDGAAGKPFAAGVIPGHPGRGTAPLAFSQRAHWNLYQLRERRVVRGVCAATRLHGRIALDLLRRSVAETVRRHSALRTRIVMQDDEPVQQIVESVGCELHVHDLSVLPEGRRASEERHLIRQYLFDEIDVASDPLFAAWLLRIRNDEHVLILATEHIISDGVSLNILLQDIFAAYLQGAKYGDVRMPDPPVQFAEYAAAQRGNHGSWLDKHARYWKERFAGCGRLNFPSIRSSVPLARPGLGLLPLQVNRDLTARLRRWCRANRTTLVMCVFAAYVGFVLRRYDVPEAVFLYQTDGRSDPKLRETIGYFAFRLCLRLWLRADDTFTDLLNRVTEEYCSAHEHADFSYVDTQVPRPDFMHNTCFNWVTRDADSFEVDAPEGKIKASHIPFEHRVVEGIEVDAEPVLGLYEAGEEIHGQLQFPVPRFSPDAMSDIWQGFVEFIGALLLRPNACVKDIRLVRR